MPADRKAVTALAKKMRQLGLPDPTAAARRELETGEPILATHSFLTWLTGEMVSPGDHGWIDRALANPGSFPALTPVLGRVLAAGVSRDDLTALVRVMQFRMCDHVCLMLDQVAVPGTVPVQDFGVYHVGGGNSPTTDKPIVRLDTLHEQIGAWDPDAEAGGGEEDEDG